jgi:superfamily I DNA/RNA helicase
VFVLNVTDDSITSDMEVGSPEQIEEERRLLCVAMTRARQQLHLVQSSRFFRSHHRCGAPNALLDSYAIRPSFCVSRA